MTSIHWSNKSYSGKFLSYFFIYIIYYYWDKGYYLEILGENGRNYSSRWNEQADFAFSDLEALKCEDWYEFGQLSLQFNQMIGRIEELIAQLGSWLPFQDAE